MEAAHHDNPGILITDDGRRLAYRYLPGALPSVVFLSGLASNMNGNKALFIENWCQAEGQACLRLDYQGHGESSGSFLLGGIQTWYEDALAVISYTLKGPLLLVGSSMGAWIMLLLARRVELPVVALLGIAAAADFSEDLLWSSLSIEEQQQFESSGVLNRTSQYIDGPEQIGIALINQGRRHLQLRRRIPVHCPVRLIHGLNDVDVPWQTSLKIVEMIESDDVRLDLIKKANHRLSTAADLAHIGVCLRELPTP